MMDFEEFKNEIKDRIKEFLSDKFEDAAVSLSRPLPPGRLAGNP